MITYTYGTTPDIEIIARLPHKYKMELRKSNMVNRYYLTLKGESLDLKVKTKEFLNEMGKILGKEINGITLIEFGQQGMMTDEEYQRSLEVSK